MSEYSEKLEAIKQRIEWGRRLKELLLGGEWKIHVWVADKNPADRRVYLAQLPNSGTSVIEYFHNSGTCRYCQTKAVIDRQEFLALMAEIAESPEGRWETE